MTGRLATNDFAAAATDYSIYTVPTGKVASFTVCMTNRTTNTVTVRIALTDTGTIGSDEFIAYEVPIYPGEVYERSGLVLNAGFSVFARASTTGVNVVIYGYEE